MQYAPIIIFGYNRPEHIKKTISALEINEGAENSEVIVFLDGKKDSDNTDKVDKTYEVVLDYSKKNKFKSFSIRKQKKNKGLACSIINGVTEVLSEYGSVIVLEDDLITTEDFITYMNGALEFYKDNHRIWSISGFSQDISAMKNRREDVYFSYRATSWSWATWNDRWILADWEVSDYDRYRYNLVKRHQFNRGGTDLAIMLDMQMAGKLNSWAIRWCYSQYKRQALTVYPKKSRIKNIGIDGSGTHGGDFCFDNDRESHQIENGSGFTDIYMDRAIINEFKKKNRLSIRSRVSRFIKLNILHI